MYDLIEQLIDHSYVTGDSMQQYIIYTCSVLIIMLTCIVVDGVFRVFSHFIRGGR